MRDVHHRDGVHLARDSDKLRVIEFARICRKSSEYDLRFHLFGDATHLVIVDFARLDVFHLVPHEIEDFGEIGDGVAVRQMPTVREIHTKYGVARLEKGHIHRDVRIRPSKGLHVRIRRTEEFFRPFNSERLHPVGKLLSAIVALARIPFRILIRERRRHRLLHRARDIVL